MLHAELKVIEGKQQGKSVPLTVKKFLIGREQDCQLRPNSELVSRHHCQLKLQHGAYGFADLGSRNGSFVNGHQVNEIALGPGDMIRIGSTEIEFQVRG